MTKPALLFDALEQPTGAALETAIRQRFGIAARVSVGEGCLVLHLQSKYSAFTLFDRLLAFNPTLVALSPTRFELTVCRP